MIRINDPELVLIANFKKFVLKERKGKQLLLVKNPNINIDIDMENDVNLTYYKKLIKEGYTKSYAVILALLLRKKVKGINLRGKHIRVYFEEKSHIKIDLNSPELIDNQVELANTVVGMYKSERKKSIMKMLTKEKGSITFKPNLRDNRSFYHETENNICCEMMCNEPARKRYIKSPIGDYYEQTREMDYHVDEEEFLEYTVTKFVESTNEEIQIKKINIYEDQFSRYSDITLKPLEYLPEGFISLSKDEQNIILDCLPCSMVKKALTIVENHNDKIKNNNKKYKKEIKNHGTN